MTEEEKPDLNDAHLRNHDGHRHYLDFMHKHGQVAEKIERSDRYKHRFRYSMWGLTGLVAIAAGFVVFTYNSEPKVKIPASEVTQKIEDYAKGDIIGPYPYDNFECVDNMELEEITGTLTLADDDDLICSYGDRLGVKQVIDVNIKVDTQRSGGRTNVSWTPELTLREYPTSPSPEETDWTTP